MNKHTLIRQAVISSLKTVITDPSVRWYDGRPAVINAEELPAVVVYLTGAQPTGGMLDEDEWRATLHVEVFLKASSPDSVLDLWMENNIYPAFSDMPELTALVELVVADGYDYQRDEEMATWGSADLRHNLNYYL
ncbi:phage tail terminator protein [Pantoea phytobeneficialis]|uniref:Phage tail protein n=1 Tax=Pantoea phytobeneficialis TaxID=2052056 RepID=A0AAP9H462_9GAMM|nr:phage tail terminator protein [Pantoea phytobeneficialis]MDO6406258.1 phage tail terminator protein [Pantoea phytobeneficialis]QGR06246.1 phage tail protein [Pantoea phytobeneficialis]